jgi:murein DD-endopeptidase MepM/ murein hydrolase activator NlpD
MKKNFFPGIALAAWVLAFVLVTAFAASAQTERSSKDFDEHFTKTIMQTFAPLHPQFALTDDGETVIIFSRIKGDIEGGPVAYYEAIFDSGQVMPLENNFLTVTPWSGIVSKVAFRAVFDDGTRGNLTQFIDLDSQTSVEGLAEVPTTDNSLKQFTLAAVSPHPPFTGRLWNYPVDAVIRNDANWLACGSNYYSNTRHIGSDLIYGIGTKVYTIGSGRVTYKSGPAESSGWGIGNYALVIKHSASTGDFYGLYGHIQTSLRVGDLVTWGRQIGTIGRYQETVNGQVIDRTPHLHFGIFPSTTGFPSSNWGRITDTGCRRSDRTNGFVAPITWINTKALVPTNICGKVSSCLVLNRTGLFYRQQKDCKTREADFNTCQQEMQDTDKHEYRYLKSHAHPSKSVAILSPIRA